MLDRFSYNAMYKNRFAYIVGGTVQDVTATITEDQTVVVPFKLEQDSDTGGSLAVEVKISNIVSPEVRLEMGLNGRKPVFSIRAFVIRLLESIISRLAASKF